MYYVCIIDCPQPPYKDLQQAHKITNTKVPFSSVEQAKFFSFLTCRGIDSVHKNVVHGVINYRIQTQLVVLAL